MGSLQERVRADLLEQLERIIYPVCPRVFVQILYIQHAFSEGWVSNTTCEPIPGQMR